METKRLFNESGSDPNQPPEKRTRTRSSFASVIGDVDFHSFFSALEPLLRRVVNEEVERGVRQLNIPSLSRSPSFRIQTLEPSSLKLIFRKKLSLPIFTGSKITDIQKNPLQIQLIDTRSGGHSTNLPQSIKIDIVVLDGDFLTGDRENWSKEEFDRSILKERTGKRPLLTGDVNVTLRDGIAPVGDIEFTDNSCWIRSRKFRIAAKVAAGNYQGPRICEAITGAFVVKDHRGELYKKHHPPMLQDEVWRLEKIGKDGVLHKRLSEAGIRTVQDFLKLYNVEPQKLRGATRMPEKMWEVIINHARTCVLGNKLYVFRGYNCVVLLNPICQVVRAIIEGQTDVTGDLNNINRTYMDILVRQAYSNWSSLEEMEGVLHESTPLLTQGNLVDQYPNYHPNNQMVARPFQQNGSITDKSEDVGFLASSSNTNANTNF